MRRGRGPSSIVPSAPAGVGSTRAVRLPALMLPASPTAPVRVVVTAEGALAAAREGRLPADGEAQDRPCSDKTESNAVLMGLASEEAVSGAFHALHLLLDVTQVIVQAQIRDGVEMFAGGLLDQQFGQVIMCGAGGTNVLQPPRDPRAG